MIETVIAAARPRPRDTDVCSVHHLPLKKDQVKIRYGLLYIPAGRYEAREKSFPNANSYVSGGCIVQEEKSEEVVYCDKCREAERIWDEAHPIPKPSKVIGHREFYSEAIKTEASHGIKTAKAIEVAAWMKDDSVTLVDLRSREAFAVSHIDGAVNIPATELTDEELKKVIPEKKTRVVVYCDYNLAPVRSIAVTTLGAPAIYQLGYKNIYRLEELWSSPDCRKGQNTGMAFGCPSLLPMKTNANMINLPAEKK